MRVLPFLLVIFLLTSALAVPVPTSDLENGEERLPALADDWSIEIVGYHGGSAPPDIAIDSMNRPHVLYCPPGEVDYAIRGPSGWTNETVFGPTGVGGVCGALSLDPHDGPFIAFDQLAYKTEGGWNYTPVPWPPYDMAVSSDGTVHITYFKRTASDEVRVQEAFLLESTWTIEDVDTLHAPSTIGSGWLSLAVEPTSGPRILYYADAIGEVRYAFKDNGTWSNEIVETIGDIRTVGLQGDIGLDSQGTVSAAYFVRTDDPYGEIRFAIRSPQGWLTEVIAGNQSFAPSLAIDSVGNPHVAFQRLTWVNRNLIVYDLDQLYAVRNGTRWSEEVVLHGHWDNTIPRGQVPQFPSLALDSCDNPHLAFFLAWWEVMDGSRSGTYYATKGECPPQPAETSVSLDIDPNVVNLKSKGRWTTAYLSTESASLYDIDISSIRLQDTLEAERYDYQDDVLMLKFNRQDLIAILEVGESVEIELSGKWNDGTVFEAFDYIRVINPGKK